MMFATIGLWLAKFAAGRFIRAYWKPLLLGTLAVAAVAGLLAYRAHLIDYGRGLERAENLAAQQAATVARVTDIANENAAIAFTLYDFAEQKAAVKAKRTNRNWEQSERLNNELFAKLGSAQPGSCDSGSIPDVAAAVEWVWREAARAGDPRATDQAERGAGPDPAPAGAAAAP